MLRQHVLREQWLHHAHRAAQAGGATPCFRHVETPEFQCRFCWQERSVAFWDNRCVQHHAMRDYYPQRRHGHRVTIRGDKPFYRP
jgi:Taurine catabolism dioxygenase TauD, TfdA family